MVAWPASLPQDQFIGLAEQRQDARLRTSMDQGPPKVRRRFTAAVKNFTVPIVLTGAQKQAFDTFYVTTLQEGTLAFDWEDPTTDATVSMRFAADVPQFAIARGGVANGDRVWTGSLSLEILP